MTVRGEIWRIIKKADKEKTKNLILSNSGINECKYCIFGEKDLVCHSDDCYDGVLQYLNQEEARLNVNKK